MAAFREDGGIDAERVAEVATGVADFREDRGIDAVRVADWLARGRWGHSWRKVTHFYPAQSNQSI